VNVGVVPRTPVGKHRREIRLPATDFRLVMVRVQNTVHDPDRRCSCDRRAISGMLVQQPITKGLN